MDKLINKILNWDSKIFDVDFKIIQIMAGIGLTLSFAGLTAAVITLFNM